MGMVGSIYGDGCGVFMGMVGGIYGDGCGVFIRVEC